MSGLFRFTELSAEVRLVVYERISTITHRDMIQGLNPDGSFYSITLIRKALSLSILTTCSTTYSEANRTLQRKLRQLECEPVCLVTDHDGIAAICTNPQTNPLMAPLHATCKAFLAHTQNMPQCRHSLEVAVGAAGLRGPSSITIIEPRTFWLWQISDVSKHCKSVLLKCEGVMYS